MLKRWQFWVGLVISVVLLYFTLRGMKLGDMWNVIKQAHYWWLIPGILVYFMGVYARAWRWHYLLRPIKKIPTWKMFPIVCIGYMGNNIYPARAGEVLRAYVLKKKEGVQISASLATIIIERIFDGVVMLAFVFLNLGALANMSGASGFIGSIKALAIWGAAIFIGVLVIFLLAAMFPKVSEKAVLWLINHLLPKKWREKATGIMLRFLTGLESLRSPKDALMVFVTSFVIWLFETGKYWFVMLAFPFRVSFFALMLMNGVVNLATTIPSAPGYIGTFDAPGIAILQAENVARDTATGYTLILHAALWFPITILGAIFFMKEGLKWGSAVQNAREEQTTSQAE